MEIVTPDMETSGYPPIVSPSNRSVSWAPKKSGLMGPMISPWSAHDHPMIYSDFVSYYHIQWLVSYSKLVTIRITGDCWWYCHGSHGPPERQRRAASPRRLRPVAPAASWHSAWEAFAEDNEGFNKIGMVNCLVVKHLIVMINDGS